MTLRRRSVLGMIGAAVAAPAMPMAAPATSRSAYGLAVAHAQKYPLVSVTGLTKRVGLSTSQAQAVIQRMSAEGLLGAINPTRPGAAHAVSKICTNDAWRAVLVNQSKPVAKTASGSIDLSHAATDAAKVSPLMAHLQGLCLSSGLTLSPRCGGVA